MDQISNTQTLLEKGPMSFVAAFFAILCFALLWLYVRAKEQHRVTQAQDAERHAKEMAENYKTSIDRMMQIQAVLLGVTELSRTLQELVVDARRRKAPRPSPANRPPEVKPVLVAEQVKP